MTDPAVRAQPDPRMQGLAADDIALLHAAARAIRDGAPAEAERLLAQVLASNHEHPEALRLLGIVHGRRARHAAAVAVLQRALELRPDDALLLNDLATAQMATGARGDAFGNWRRACALAPTQAMPWFNLGRNLQLAGDSDAAVEALTRAAALAPDMLPAAILLGDALVHLGRFDEAATRYRDALRLHPACGDAWRGLANIKTRPLSDGDGKTLAAQLQRTDISPADRVAMGYALGKHLEDHGRYPQAFAALANANTLFRQRAPWNATALRAYVDAALAATRELPTPLEPGLGKEVVFIVGLPRSGSTLIEQVLCAHGEVEGASELPDLGQLIQEESIRRQRPYPQWIAEADAQDWLRLGRGYLERTRRWRARRPRFTDKMPENWKHAGILRAMLPGATVIEVRRDPLETAWSCFRQQFYQLPHFSCTFDDIAAYLDGCESAMDAWRARDPRRILLQRYEALLAAPEAQVRALLAACGLPFDAACLESHRAERSVRTASAAQVREPLRGDTARSHHYGALLDPLRAALAARGKFPAR
jgi:tetratricopeptide (TPR) repeat protein